MHNFTANYHNMFRTKALDIIKSLEESEFKKFRDFLLSPYFNKNKKMIKLYEYLKRFYPEFNDPKLTNESLHLFIYQGKKYNDRILKNLLSDFFRLTEKFIVQSAVDNDIRINLKKLASEYAKRGTEKNFTNALEKLLKITGDSGFNSDYFRDRMFLGSEMLNFLSLRSRQHESIGYLEESAFNVLFDFLVSHYKIWGNILLIGEYYKKETDGPSILQVNDFINHDGLFKFIEKNFPDEYKFIAPYYFAVCSILHPENDGHYFSLKEHLKKNISHFSFKEKFLLIANAENMCAKKINSGKSHYMKELFDLNIIRLENKLFSYSGSSVFHPTIFRNVCKMAITQNELDWTKDFIEDYSKYLPADDKKNTVQFCLMLVNFEAGKFEAALKNANSIELNSSFYKLEVKSFIMLIYFELGYYNEGIDLALTFKKFLTGNKELSAFQKDTYSAFTTSYMELCNYKENSDTERINNVKKIFYENPSIGLKKWLQKKIEELEK